MTDPAALAARLDEAALAATAIPQLTSTAPLDVAGAYDVQRLLVERALARGGRLSGLKMGLTSRAKMEQVGVDQPIWGRLADTMRVPDGGSVAADRLIHPRVEPEVAFLIDADGAPAAAAAALEIIDSRYADFRFTLPDVIADNTSAARYVVGPWHPLPAGLDNLGVLLEIDGQVVHTGSTAAILGDPRRALAQGLRLSRDSVRPEHGWVFLAGAATAAVPVTPGTRARAVVESLGTASLEVRP